jgi:hypothetical protein
LFNKEQKDKIFRNYITECLKILCENTCVPANYYSNGKLGKYITLSYDEIINPKPQEDIDPHAVINRIKSKFRG